jgi:hypothetical protein
MGRTPTHFSFNFKSDLCAVFLLNSFGEKKSFLKVPHIISCVVAFSMSDFVRTKQVF